MRKNIFICLAVLMVVLNLQCTGIITPGGGSERTSVKETELLRINYLEIAPSEVVHPGEKIFVRMEVENIGQKDVDVFINTSSCDQTPEGGKLLLYSICEPLYVVDEFRILSTGGEETTVSADLNYDGTPEKICALKLKPDETAIFFWKISAPTKEELFGMTHECNFKFRVMYKSQAQTTAYIYFASYDEIVQRMYTQEDLKEAGNNIATSGPVVVMVTAEDQPYPADGTFTLPVHIENRGNGIVDVLDLSINYPQNFELIPNRCELFEPSGGSTISLSSARVAREMLQIYGGKSSQFHCEFKAPPVSMLTPFRFDVTATYLYSIFEEKKVRVVPYERD